MCAPWFICAPNANARCSNIYKVLLIVTPVVDPACNRPDRSLSYSASPHARNSRVPAACCPQTMATMTTGWTIYRRPENGQPDCGKRVSFPQLKVRPFRRRIALLAIDLRVETRYFDVKHRSAHGIWFESLVRKF